MQLLLLAFLPVVCCLWGACRFSWMLGVLCLVPCSELRTHESSSSEQQNVSCILKLIKRMSSDREWEVCVQVEPVKRDKCRCAGSKQSGSRRAPLNRLRWRLCAWRSAALAPSAAVPTEELPTIRAGLAIHRPLLGIFLLAAGLWLTARPGRAGGLLINSVL